MTMLCSSIFSFFYLCWCWIWNNLLLSPLKLCDGTVLYLVINFYLHKFCTAIYLQIFFFVARAKFFLHRYMMRYWTLEHVNTYIIMIHKKNMSNTYDIHLHRAFENNHQRAAVNVFCQWLILLMEGKHNKI